MSFYRFLYFMKTRKLPSFFLVFAYIAAACIMHSGVIALALIYIVCIPLRQTDSIKKGLYAEISRPRIAFHRYSYPHSHLEVDVCENRRFQFIGRCCRACRAVHRRRSEYPLCVRYAGEYFAAYFANSVQNRTVCICSAAVDDNQFRHCAFMGA